MVLVVVAMARFMRVAAHWFAGMGSRWWWRRREGGVSVEGGDGGASIIKT
jgi:hypothetical protein